MSHKLEADRVGRGRASDMFRSRDNEEDTASTLHNQSVWLAARYNVGAAHARCLAELAFGKVATR